jgi:hypothetical protein
MSAMVIRSGLAAAFLAFAVIPATAFAQSAPPASASPSSAGPSVPLVTGDIPDAQSNFARDNNVAVRERPRSEYEAIGIHVGGFTLYPTLEGDVTYDDNVFATPTNKTSDTVWQFKPEVVLQSIWSRHFLRFNAGASVNDYSQHSNESTTDWNVGAHGGLDFAGRSQVTGDLEADRLTEPRTDSSAASPGALTPKPVRYDQYLADLGWTKEFNRLKLGVRGDLDSYTYDNQPGFEEDLRDRTVSVLTGRADYAVSPATAVFAEVSANNRNFRNDPPPGQVKQDSSGYEVLAGVNFELGHLMRGELGAGYLSQSYKASALRDVSGLGARAKLEWFPTQLTTVTAHVDRSVQDSGVVAAGGLTGGYLYTESGLQVDHELLRNVILTGGVSYTNSAYKEISRTDDRWMYNAGATYLLNRHVGLNLNFSTLHQNSFGSASPILLGNKFTDNKATIGIVLAF